MALSAVVDLNALVAPISGDKPAGESVRYSGIYDAIQEARRADDELPMGDWQREAKTADWLTVINLSTEALANKSKDLQLAVWLAEALVKRTPLVVFRPTPGLILGPCVTQGRNFCGARL